MTEEDAIVVRDARKRYGKSANPILDGLNLTVAHGSIYGLLGASGCGKTTLLSCVVGVRSLDSGDIWVLGGRPGTAGSGIPGPRVGYMPQEISLIGEFSVIGALYYFGRVNGMDSTAIEERHSFLSKLLQLPPRGRLVKNCSGGQQRRISFAAAMVHNPELLILDEPTVGLDPILRENIWNHLVKITQEEGITVIITTHYIEETRQANKIGLLRYGKLLAEASPYQLLIKFQCETLEGAFLALSQRQKDNYERGITETNQNEFDDIAPTPNNNVPETSLSSKKKVPTKYTHDEDNARSCFRYKKFYALLVKNYTQFARHPGGIIFAFILPIIQVYCYFLAIGGAPKGHKLAVVNDEAYNCNFGANLGKVIYSADNDTCQYIDLSCRFLDAINDTILEKQFYTNISDAKGTVDGRTVGVMHFASNFSAAMEHRKDDFYSSADEDIMAGEISIWLDMGDRQVSFWYQKQLMDIFYRVSEGIVQECNIPKKFANIPMNLENPVYGSSDDSYSSALAPGFIVVCIFFLATSVASSIIISDRHEGVWDRSLVQGVTTTEILFAHLATQISVILLQGTVILSLCFLNFGLIHKGSMLTICGLVFLQGVTGMCYGFFISVVCPTHTMGNYMALGTFYPLVLMSGLLWPINGMPLYLMYVSLILPTTVPSVSLRGLLVKGATFLDPEVYQGFLVMAAWIVCLVAFCLFKLKGK